MGARTQGGRGHICMLIAVSLRLAEVTSLAHIWRILGALGGSYSSNWGSGQCIHPSEVTQTVHDRLGPRKMLPNPDS